MRASSCLCYRDNAERKKTVKPDGNDPDSFLRTHPSGDFRRLLDSAEPVIAFQIRILRAKEKNPAAIDAVKRIAREILATIAVCPNAILRAGMVAEAARLTGLPSAALAEELGKIKIEAPQPASAGADAVPDGAAGEESGDGAAVEQADARDAIPPPPRETAFCEFLLANENCESVKTLDGMAAEFLPPAVFSHELPRAFLSEWSMQARSGEDLIAPWSRSLDGNGRAWFDRILAGQQKALASDMPATDIMKDFVRLLWIDRLSRIRGAMPASGDRDSGLKRMEITLALKRLATAKWSDAKDLIRKWMETTKEEN